MIDEDGGNDEIVRAIVTLARNLGLTVVAEGVETAAQLAVLKNLECESVQGFLFAQPMRFETLRDFIANSDQPGTLPEQFGDLPVAPFIQ